MQRVRIGVTGLAVVFLLVLLAAALLGMLRRESAQRGAQVAGAQGGVTNVSSAETPKEPLAELGVAPGSGPSTVPAASAPAVPGQRAGAQPAAK